jgi:hypothetical protein
MEMTTCKEGDFSFIEYGFVRDIYEDAWNTVHSRPEYIEFIKNKSSDEPWMFIEHETANKIYKSLKYINTHSGASAAFVMRAMEDIIKYGWNTWVQNYSHK